jgi:hypothetical protein
MKKMVYESPELMMDKFESEDIMLVSQTTPADCDGTGAQSNAYDDLLPVTLF